MITEDHNPSPHASIPSQVLAEERRTFKSLCSPLSETDRRREYFTILIEHRQHKNHASILGLDVTSIEAYNECRVSKRFNTYVWHQKGPKERPFFCLENSCCGLILRFERFLEGSNDPKGVS